MHGHSGPVHALLWLEARGWLVSGSSDATIRTWRVRCYSDGTKAPSETSHRDSAAADQQDSGREEEQDEQGQSATEEPDWKAQRKAELAAELERVRNGQPQDETLVPASSSEEEGGARP